MTKTRPSHSHLPCPHLPALPTPPPNPASRACRIRGQHCQCALPAPAALRCAERLIMFSQAGMVLGCLPLTQPSGQTPPAQLPYSSQGIGGCMAFRFGQSEQIVLKDRVVQVVPNQAVVRAHQVHSPWAASAKAVSVCRSAAGCCCIHSSVRARPEADWAPCTRRSRSGLTIAMPDLAQRLLPEFAGILISVHGLVL